MQIEPGSSLDTPIDRATINQLTVEELDKFLDGIRERRLTNVRKLEAIAKVKADDAQLVVYLKFEKQIAKVKKLLGAATEQEAKIEQEVNKVRALAIEMGA